MRKYIIKVAPYKGKHEGGYMALGGLQAVTNAPIMADTYNTKRDAVARVKRFMIHYNIDCIVYQIHELKDVLNGTARVI